MNLLSSESMKDQFEMQFKLSILSQYGVNGHMFDLLYSFEYSNKHIILCTMDDLLHLAIGGNFFNS